MSIDKYKVRYSLFRSYSHSFRFSNLTKAVRLVDRIILNDYINANVETSIRATEDRIIIGPRSDNCSISIESLETGKRIPFSEIKI